jgi:hypothetical protein
MNMPITIITAPTTFLIEIRSRKNITPEKTAKRGVIEDIGTARA